MGLGVLQEPIHVIFRIPLVRIFTAVFELDHSVIYFPSRFLTPCVCFLNNSIRHGIPREFAALQNMPRNQTKKLDGTIEITSGTYSDFWVGAWVDGIAGVGFIMDLGIIPKFNAVMLFPTQIGSYHDGSGGEFLGKSIFHGECIQPKNARIYHTDYNRLVQSIEWQITCHGAASFFYGANAAFNFCNMFLCGGGVNHPLPH